MSDDLLGVPRFRVEVDGVDIGQYTEVTGLEVEVEVYSHAEGGVNGHLHRLPGRMVWPNIVLRRGVSNDDNLLKWFNDTTGKGFAASGKLERKTAAISLIGSKNKVIRAWSLIDAVPIRWSGPTLAAGSNMYPMEELEVAHHGFTSGAS